MPVTDDDDQIARYLAMKGATKCPTACAAETSGRVAENDRVAIAGHGDRVSGTMHAAFIGKIKERHRRRVEELRRGLGRLRRAAGLTRSGAPDGVDEEAAEPSPPPPRPH